MDTGLTLTRLRAYMLEQCGAASCKVQACTVPLSTLHDVNRLPAFMIHCV